MLLCHLRVFAAIGSFFKDSGRDYRRIATGKTKPGSDLVKLVLGHAQLDKESVDAGSGNRCRYGDHPASRYAGHEVHPGARLGGTIVVESHQIGGPVVGDHNVVGRAGIERMGEGEAVVSQLTGNQSDRVCTGVGAEKVLQPIGDAIVIGVVAKAGHGADSGVARDPVGEVVAGGGARCLEGDLAEAGVIVAVGVGIRVQVPDVDDEVSRGGIGNIEGQAGARVVGVGQSEHAEAGQRRGGQSAGVRTEDLELPGAVEYSGIRTHGIRIKIHPNANPRHVHRCTHVNHQNAGIA